MVVDLIDENFEISPELFNSEDFFENRGNSFYEHYTFNEPLFLLPKEVYPLFFADLNTIDVGILGVSSKMYSKKIQAETIRKLNHKYGKDFESIVMAEYYLDKAQYDKRFFGEENRFLTLNLGDYVWNYYKINNFLLESESVKHFSPLVESEVLTYKNEFLGKEFDYIGFNDFLLKEYGLEDLI